MNLYCFPPKEIPISNVFGLFTMYWYLYKIVMTSFSFYKISNAIQSYFAIKVKVDKEVVVFFFSSWCLMRRARTATMLVGTFTAVLNS